MLNLFNSKKKTELNLPVMFYKDTAGLPVHGSIYASHVGFNLTDEAVNFSFGETINEVPVLDPTVLAHIWDQAAISGFVAQSLRSYATVFTVMPPPRSNLPNQTRTEKPRR